MGMAQQGPDPIVIRPVMTHPGLSPNVSSRKGIKQYVTSDDLPVNELYGPAPDKQDPEALAEQLGEPGTFPFTRGIQPNMYRGRLWTMRQYAGYGSARESNERFRYLLSQGQSGLSVAFDLPTQMGYDADSEWAQGEVGKAGVSICSLHDMQVLLKDLPLERISLSMTINAPAAILLAMVIGTAQHRGMDLKQLSGTIQNDILKEYIARGTYIFPPRPSLRLVTDVIRYCREHVPRWNPISISGYHMREAGCTAAQEVAFTFANAKAYVQAVLETGMPVDAFAGRLSFFFNAHNNLLEEVAKFRAARRLWARIMHSEFKVKDPRSCRLRFHTQTGGSTLTAQQPVNNVVRVTVQALAAILGGTQSLHTNALDEALALPTEESAQVALRTQQILAHESGVADTVDPLGGSYYIEHLTGQIEKRAQAYLTEIEAIGGTLAAIETGYVQQSIQAAAYRTQSDIETGTQLQVGVNCFADDGGEVSSANLLKVDEAVQAEQIARVRHLRQHRDDVRTRDSLHQLENAARTSDGCLMPLLVEAVMCDATVGEICDCLRSVWGEYRAESWL